MESNRKKFLLYSLNGFYFLNLEFTRSEITNAALVDHFLVVDINRVGRSSLQIPSVFHLVSAGVSDDWSTAPEEVLGGCAKRWSTVRFIWSTNLMSLDFLLLI
jgi:hypothetical protein